MSDTEDLKIKMKEMVSKCEEIIEMLNNTKKKIDESVDYFDTPTAKKFRDKATDYIETQKLLINNELIPSFEILNTISDAYKEDYEKERKLFGNLAKKGDKNE